jgi:hypothetical protein
MSRQELPLHITQTFLCILRHGDIGKDKICSLFFSLYKTTNEEFSWHPDMSKARSVLRDKARESFYLGNNNNAKESLKRPKVQIQRVRLP